MEQLFRAWGHDVHTVREERLTGCSDDQIYELCRTEFECMSRRP